MPAAAAAASDAGALFLHPPFAEGVADWLANRASPAEAERTQRYLRLIREATAASNPGYVREQQHQLQLQAARQRPAPAAGTASGSSLSEAPQQQWGYATTTRAARMRGLVTQQQHRPASGGVPAAPKPAPMPPLPLQQPAAPLPQAATAATTPPELAVLSARASATTRGARALYVSTSAAMHGLRNIAPELWAATVPICRAAPAPDRNFVSEWGASLARGADEAWAPHLASTNSVTNAQVVKPTNECAARADEARCTWAATQATYAASLLAPPSAAAAARLLAGSNADSTITTTGAPPLPLAQRKELLAVLRQLAAVVQPASRMSTTHQLHCRQVSVEQLATVALLRESVRARTMGAHRQVAVKGFAAAPRTCSAAATAATKTGSSSATPGSALASAAAAGGGGRGGAATRQLVDTQSSRVPLKWAASSGAEGGLVSSYTAAHSVQFRCSPQMHKTVFRDVCVGYGHVDPHVLPSAAAAEDSSQTFLVPARYLAPPAHACAQPHDSYTTYRTSYAPQAVATSGGQQQQQAAAV